MVNSCGDSAAIFPLFDNRLVMSRGDSAAIKRAL